MSHNLKPLPKNLVLASSSPYRKQLFSRLRLPFESRTPAVPELPRRGESRSALAYRLSVEKAQAVAKASDPDTLYIGSDQVATCARQLLGKPGTLDKAQAQLQLCSGQQVTFYTGFALWRPTSHFLHGQVVTTTVTLRRLSDSAIARYLQSDSPFDCAGSFKWESLGISLFESLASEDPTALEGLPLIGLCTALRAQGYALP